MHVIYVAPFLLPATRRFLGALAALDGIRLGLISQDPLESLPTALRERLAGHVRVASALDPRQIILAANTLARGLGPIHRLIGTLEDMQVPLAVAREQLGVAGMTARVAENFRDKSQMKDVLRHAGIPCARHLLSTSTAAAVSFASEVGFPLVAKPPAGAGARSTYQLEDLAALRNYLAAMPPTVERPVMLEEFVQGDEHSFDCVSIRGRPIWHSLTRYYPTPLDVLRNPWIQWCVLLPRELDAPTWDPIRDYGTRALAALGMETGLSHMEWFRRRDGSVAISEVGARPPGAQFVTLMSHAHNTDMYLAWARLMVFERFELPARHAAAGAAYLRGMGRGRIARIHGVEQAQREIGELVVEARLPQIGQQASSSYEGDGYVIISHPRTEVVQHALQRLISLIRVEYAGDH